MTRTKRPQRRRRVAAISAALCVCGVGLLASQPRALGQTETQTATQTRATDDLSEVVVYFRDGRSLEGGLVRRDAAEIVLRVAGIETTLRMSEILRVDRVAPVDEHYQRLRAVISDDDVEQLLVLCDWLRDRKAYSLALQELAHVLQVDPGNPEAQSLKLLVESQVQLAASARPVPKVDPDRPEHRRRPVFPTLTPDQINLLRVYEVNLGDPPELWVDAATVEQLISEYDGNELIPATREGRAALVRRPAARILELMFHLKARDYYNRVRVKTEPEAFRRFRQDVHSGWLVNSCASDSCHGGQDAGRLWLNNERKNSEATIYTNFLILERYRLADGTPLIDYEDPARSPLLQMALPREESLYPHPLVGAGRGDAWRPVIGSTDDLRFAEAVRWINAMYRPRPEYPVTYQPPVPPGGVPELPVRPGIDR